jgi:O-antigen/teichoic acid export membrane protein
VLTALRSKFQSLISHQGLRRYGANTSWMLGEKILRMSVGLFVGIWVARYLGPEQFGLLSYAQSFVFLFTAIATLGLDGIVVRELVKDESRREELLGTAFGLKFIGAILILPVLWLAVQLTSNDTYTNLLVFIIASATVFQSFNVIDFYYQAKVKSKYVALANTLALGVSSAIKIILILTEAPLMAFAAMVTFDAFILSLGLVFFYKVSSRHRLFSWKFRVSTAKRLLKDSWPLILSGLVISVYMKIDQVMIKEMLNSDAVGQYAAAVRLSEAWYFIPMVIANSVFPAIINAKKVSNQLYLQRLQRLYTLMIWMAIGIALPMTFLSNWLTTLLYGQEYQEAGPVLMVHIWASVFVSVGVASSKWMLSENFQFYSMCNTSIGAAVNITLNWLLIKWYGVSGAALATLISYGIAAYLMLFVWHRTRSNFVLIAKSVLPAGYINDQRTR